MGRKTGMLPYRIEVTDDGDAVTAFAGLPLVVETMRTLGVSGELDAQLGIRQRNNGATDAQKAEALVLLMAAGGTCLSDINKLHADKGLERLLGRELRPADVQRAQRHEAAGVAAFDGYGAPEANALRALHARSPHHFTCRLTRDAHLTFGREAPRSPREPFPPRERPTPLKPRSSRAGSL